MALDIRAVGFALFLIAAGVIIYAMSGPHGGSGDKPAATTQTQQRDPLPWVLKYRWRRSLTFKPVKPPNRFPSKEICEAEADKRREQEGEAGQRVTVFVCRYEPRS